MMMLMMVGGSRRVFGVFFSSTLGMIWVTMKASDGQTAWIESSQQLEEQGDLGS
jgi:hypothetical protein